MPTSPQANPTSNPALATVTEYYAGGVGGGRVRSTASRPNEAPQQQQPEVRQNGGSGFIYTAPGASVSEKGPVPIQATTQQLSAANAANEALVAATNKQRFCSTRMIVVAVVITCAFLIALGVGLGLAFAPSRHNSSSSTTLPSNTAASRGHSPTTGSKTTAIYTATGTASLEPTVAGNSPAPTGVDFNGNDFAVVGLAGGVDETATGTITVLASTYGGAVQGGLQTAGVFHSSTFSPVNFVSSVTYTAAAPGATAGLGFIDCPSENGSYYVAGGGAVFQKRCYADVAAAPNLGSTVANSLDACIEACALQLNYNNNNGNPAPVGVGTFACQGVAYGANITLALIDQKANCWFKTTLGYPSSGDWQQSTAILVGWLANNDKKKKKKRTDGDIIFDEMML